jgi:hypothetical protein
VVKHWWAANTRAVTFLKAAIAYYASLGITVERGMTDNGPCYKAIRACRAALGDTPARVSAAVRHSPIARPAPWRGGRVVEC